MKAYIKDAAFLPFWNKRLHGEDNPKNFEWVQGDNPNGTVFITDSFIQRVDEVKAKRKIAWLLEPPGFRQMNYDYVLAHADKFHYILTYVEYMHQAIPKKCLYYHMGYTMLTPDQIVIPSIKSKKISFILSPKQAATGHRLRHRILNELAKEIRSEIDIFGLDGFTPKWDCLSEYMFSIVVMGENYNWCLDEKIIDCFLARTVPVFWGYPSLAEREGFDALGIRNFTDIGDLSEVLGYILWNTKKLYYDSRIQKAIETNRRIALEISSDADEEYIWNHHRFLFEE